VDLSGFFYDSPSTGQIFFCSRKVKEAEKKERERLEIIAKGSKTGK